jgi:hypothetical protein
MENNTDFMLTYSKDITPRYSSAPHWVVTLGPFSYRSSYATTDYLNVPGWYNMANSLNPVKSYTFYAPMQVLSGYGYVDLSYRDFINLSVTGRVDKHSALPKSEELLFLSFSFHECCIV